MDVCIPAQTSIKRKGFEPLALVNYVALYPSSSGEVRTRARVSVVIEWRGLHINHKEL